MPGAPQYKAPGLDLDEAECNALVAYVGGLAAPTAREASSRREANFLKAGVGSSEPRGVPSAIHPTSAKSRGYHSDLLLHDTGEALGDAGAYSLFEAGEPAKPSKPTEENSGPNAREWRTPPLWGFRDSGPCLARRPGRGSGAGRGRSRRRGHASRPAISSDLRSRSGSRSRSFQKSA